jgi:hypothetical protein
MTPHSHDELSIAIDRSPFAIAANPWPPRDPDDEDLDEEDDEDDENDSADEPPVVREPDED